MLAWNLPVGDGSGWILGEWLSESILDVAGQQLNGRASLFGCRWSSLPFLGQLCP